MIPERKNVGQRGRIRCKKLSAWYSCVEIFTISEKFPLQAAGRFVEQYDRRETRYLTTLQNKKRAMDITNFSPIPSSQNIQGLHRASSRQSAESVRQTPLRDTVSFSEEALRLSDVAQTNAGSTKIRFDLVNRIKSEIAAGTYDTPDKMDIAIERMANRIF